MRKYIKEEITDRVCRIMVSISNIMQCGVLNQDKRIKSNLKKIEATFQFLLSQIFTSILLSEDLDRSVTAWSLIETSLKKELRDDDAIITEIDLIISDTERIMQEIKSAILNVQLAETNLSRWTNVDDKKDQIAKIEKEIEETKNALE